MPANTDVPQDVLGLVTVWEPENSPIAADIVAVHGLAHGSRSTWRHQNGTDLLSDLLPKESGFREPGFPGFRVLTFGYPAQDVYYSGRKKRGVTGRLMTFAERLGFELGFEEQRPVIFLCHGIGGLVVRRALLENEELLLRTYHMFFFDTPHSGFNIDAWKLLTGESLTIEAREEFQPGSTTLAELTTGLSGKEGPNPRVWYTTFYIPDPPNLKERNDWITSESSSKLQVPSELRCEFYQVNHLTMLQYPDSADSNYRIFKNRLRLVLSRPPTSGNNHQLVRRQHNNNKVVKHAAAQDSEATMDWLSGYDFIDTHKRLASMRCIQTTEWILQDPEFRAWLEAPRSSCFWCSGNVGVGKSIVCSKVIDTCKDTLVLHAYASHGGTNILKTVANVLNSIIKQILVYFKSTKDPQITSVLEKLTKARKQGQDGLSADHARQTLVSLLKGLKKVFIVIDGLDECASNVPDTYDNEAYSLLKAFKICLREASETQIKLFLAGRPEVIVGKIFKACFHVALSDKQHEHNISDDIRIFVEEEVDRKIWLPGLTTDKQLLEEIKEKLRLGARGMFLWVKLQIQALCEDCKSDAEFRDEIQHLPLEIYDIYEKCLTRIPLTGPLALGHWRRPVVVLKIVLGALRPLHVDEIRQAAASGIQITESPPSPIHIRKQVRSASLEDVVWNINACGGLIYLDELDNIVRLVHPSARQYLFLEPPAHFIDDLQFSANEADRFLGNICLTYLACDNFSTALQAPVTESQKADVPPPLAVVENVHRHSPGAFGKFTRMMIRTKKIGAQRRSKDPVAVTIKTETEVEVPTSEVSKYSFLSYARSYWALHTKLIESPNIFRSDEGSFHFKLVVLVERPNETWKLQPWLSEAKSVGFSKAAFEWAVRHDHVPILRITCANLDPNAIARTRLSNGMMAIHLAAAEGLQNVLRFLGVTGYLLDSIHPGRAARIGWDLVDDNGWSIVHHAAANGRYDLLQDVLERNIPGPQFINSKGKDSSTPLFLAISKDHPSIVELLMEHGACKIKRTPLSEYVLDIKELQLELKLVVSQGQAGVLSRLVSYVDLKDKAMVEFIRSLVGIALELESPDCVRLLIEWCTTHSIDHNLDIMAIARRRSAEVLEIVVQTKTKIQLQNFLTLDLFQAVIHWQPDEQKRSVLQFLLMLARKVSYTVEETISNPPPFRGEIRSSSVPTAQGIQPSVTVTTNPSARSLDYYALLKYAVGSEDASEDIVRDIIDDMKEHNVLLRDLDKALIDQLFQAANDSTNFVAKFMVLIENGAGANVVALAYAIKSNKPDALRTWLANGIDPNAKMSAKGNDDLDPLYLATRLQRLEMVSILLEHGAHPDGFHTGTLPDDCATSLSMAISKGDLPIVTKLVNAKADVKRARVLESLAYCSLSDEDFESVLTLLMQNGLCMTNAWDDEKKSILMISARKQYHRRVQILLERGAPVNQLDASNQNALHYALTRHKMYRTNQSDAGVTDTVRLLVESEIDLNVVSSTGFTSLDRFYDPEYMSSGILEVDKILRDAGAKKASEIQAKVQDESKPVEPFLVESARHGSQDLAIPGSWSEE